MVRFRRELILRSTLLTGWNLANLPSKVQNVTGTISKESGIFGQCACTVAPCFPSFIKSKGSADLPDGLFCHSAVQPCVEKYFASPFGRNSFIDSTVHPKEGRIAIVTDAGLDAMDAGGAADESATCGRRSRVVLTPRRWRQVSRSAMSALTGLTRGYPRGDGGKQARSPGRARRKPLKPLCAGMPGEPVYPW
jgi:hypothetical protein